MMKYIYKIASMIGRISFVLAVLAYLPSIAPFTPALLISFAALFGAVIGCSAGEWRLALLTSYIVGATCLVSPISKWIEEYITLSLLVVGLVIGGIIVTVVLHMDYKSSETPC